MKMSLEYVNMNIVSVSIVIVYPALQAVFSLTPMNYVMTHVRASMNTSTITSSTAMIIISFTAGKSFDDSGSDGG